MGFLLQLDLPVAILLFVVSTVAIAIGGTALTREGDKLADITGMGEALVGALFLGGITSLSGIIMSVTAAYDGFPELSVSNAIGGIAAQTAFLAIADIAYKKANLEHAAASLSNVMQAVVLIGVLVCILIFNGLPAATLFHIHPGSIIIFALYIGSQRMISLSQEDPMWKAVKTRETREDVPEEDNIRKYKLSTVLLKFVLLGAVIGISGFALAKSAVVISAQTGLSQGVVGALFTAVASSLPELIVSVSAVRQGALTLAVSNVIGGNAFDVLFVALSDVAYTEGSIYHTFRDSQVFTIHLTLALTVVLTMGLLYRQKKGIARIGWESLTVLILFLVGYAVLFYL